MDRICDNCGDVYVSDANKGTPGAWCNPCIAEHEAERFERKRLAVALEEHEARIWKEWHLAEAIENDNVHIMCPGDIGRSIGWFMPDCQCVYNVERAEVHAEGPGGALFPWPARLPADHQRSISFDVPKNIDEGLYTLHVKIHGTVEEIENRFEPRNSVFIRSNILFAEIFKVFVTRHDTGT